MKKLILSIFVLSAILLTTGGVSAVNFVSPTGSGSEYFSNELNVDWENPSSIPGLYLQYKKENCTDGIWGDLNNGQQFPGGVSNYNWDTTQAEDGKYCLRLQYVEITYATTGDFVIDNTEPVADFIYSGSLIIGEEIKFNASSSNDNNGIKNYTWNFADGGVEFSGKEATHIFSNAGSYNVVLTVTDYAGNKKTATETIIISPIEFEETEIQFEAGILGIKDLNENDSFDTGVENVGCNFIGEIPEDLEIGVGDDGNSCILDWSDIPYEERGAHEFSVKATNGTETKYFNVEVIVYSWMINLEEGWNLVSIPMMPKDTSINAVLGNIIESVSYDSTGAYTIFQYDAVNGRWYRARKYSDNSGYSGPSSYKLTTIVPGYGYWIKMNSSDTLKGIGSITPEIDGAIIGINVANGWNLIGHYGLKDLVYGNALKSLTIGDTKYYDAVATADGNMYHYEGYWMTAKFIPNGITLYTPSQTSINYLIQI